MVTFLKFIKTLTQHLQSNKTLDPYSFDLIQLASISKKDLSLLKKETKNLQLINCHEFWELTEEIYKHLMLPTIGEKLQAYFIQLQKEATDDLKIQYQFHPWKEFQLTSSNGTAVTHELQTKYAENQIQSFLDALGVQDSNWKDDLYDFDYKFNFESEVERLFRDIAFECWEQAKSITQSEIQATLKEVNGGSQVYDLGTGEVADS